MKNLTRVLALVLTFAMMISTVAFAASFADIEAGSTYAEATAVLADLGILKGYEDGTFGADKVITRAEVVAVVNRLQGLSDAAKAAGGATQYTDVPSTEWYAGDVNLATQMGIVSGDGNGLFRPNDQVKYEEAVKMVVAALGYNQEYVLKRGGWPTGYLVIATEAEVSKGVAAGAGEPAYRGIVAKLAYNALTAKTFAFTGYNSNGVANYQPSKEEIILETKLQAYKLTGTVVANSITALKKAVTENDEVEFEITENKAGKEVDGWAKGDFDKFLVGATDVAATLGNTVDIYVKANADGDYVIVSYVINNAKNNTVVIEDPTVIESVYGTPDYPSVLDGADGDYISVYDEDVDTRNTEYKLEKDAILIVNGEKQGYIADFDGVNMYDLGAVNNANLGLIWAPNYGKVTLLDNNKDGEAEYVFVESYEVAVVADVISTASTKLIVLEDGEINLRDHIEGKTGYKYAITIDGEKAELADLQKDDVLAVAMSESQNSYDIKATRKTVSGLVSEVDSSSDEYIVDGEAYKLANVADASLTGITKVGLGSEVTFYLDAFNNIAKAKITSSAAKNYGFIVAADKETSFGAGTVTVKLLDKDGNIQTLELAENIKANLKDDASAITNDGAINSKSFKAEKVYDSYINTTEVKPAAGWALFEENAAGNIDNYAKRIVSYKLNSNGLISSIAFPAAREDGTEAHLTYGGHNTLGEYNEKTAMIDDQFAVDENTVVFNLPMVSRVEAADLKVESISALTHEENYQGAVLALDDEFVAGIVLIVNRPASVTKGSNLAVVKRIMETQNAEGDTIKNITLVQAGEEKKIATTTDIAETVTFAIGDVFEYALNDEGAIKAVSLGYDAAYIAANYGPEKDDAKEAYVYATVYEKNSSRLVIGDKEVDQRAHAVSADANYILVDLTKTDDDGNLKSAAVSVSSNGEIRKYKAGYAEYDYTVFMKYFNDEITDVVIFKGANALNLGK